MVSVRIAMFSLVCLVAACAPGATNMSASGAAAGAKHVVELNLTKNGPVSTAYGTAGGSKPAVLTVNVGDTIVFKNSDSFAHTASSLKGSAFPAASPLTVKALTKTGATLSAGWSSGLMQPGSSSQAILADKAGTYLYGCFPHYAAPMRAAIIAR